MFYPSVEVICGFAGLVRDLDIDPLHERLRLCDVLSRHCANVELGDDVVPAVLAEHTTTLAPGPVLSTDRSSTVSTVIAPAAPVQHNSQASSVRAGLGARNLSITRELGIFKHDIVRTDGHSVLTHSTDGLCDSPAASDVTLTSVSL